LDPVALQSKTRRVGGGGRNIVWGPGTAITVFFFFFFYFEAVCVIAPPSTVGGPLTVGVGGPV